MKGENAIWDAFLKQMAKLPSNTTPLRWYKTTMARAIRRVHGREMEYIQTSIPEMYEESPDQDNDLSQEEDTILYQEDPELNAEEAEAAHRDASDALMQLQAQTGKPLEACQDVAKASIAAIISEYKAQQRVLDRMGSGTCNSLLSSYVQKMLNNKNRAANALRNAQKKRSNIENSKMNFSPISIQTITQMENRGHCKTFLQRNTVFSKKQRELQAANRALNQADANAKSTAKAFAHVAGD
jgi:hypothetical protein